MFLFDVTYICFVINEEEECKIGYTKERIDKRDDRINRGQNKQRIKYREYTLNKGQSKDRIE